MPRTQVRRRRRSLTLRTVAFVGLAVAIVGLALGFGRPKELAFIEIGPGSRPSAPVAAPHAMTDATMAPSSAAADLTTRIDMAGFTPADLAAPPGRATRLRIVNPDNDHHSDGAGIHGFTVPGLGVDVRVPPLTTMVITLPAADAGDYPFYCDTCCGGKENPSMQGVLRVRA